MIIVQKFSLNSLNSPRNRHGFTVIELVIVIVVIGILATISIVVYSGVTTRAVETSMQSDLDTGSSVLEFDNRQNGSYPASALLANGGNGLATSPGNVLTYVTKTYGYCLSVVNSASSNTYVYRSSTRVIESGSCAPVISTLAGSNVQGSANGTGTSAQFYHPQGIAIDTSGTIYVADSNNGLIRKITSGGVVSTLAGSGLGGNADGTGTSAGFTSPYAVAVDTSGTVYVADPYGQRIRKITAGGVVTTVTGSTFGYVDGTLNKALFNYPQGIVVDTSGSIFVADSNNNRIRKITTVVATFVGSGSSSFADGTGTGASLNLPGGSAIDSSGNLFVADTSNQRIRKITPSGVVTTLAGSGTIGSADGPGISAQFNYPGAVAVDTSGNVYVTDTHNNTIRKITSDGTVTTLAGSTQGFADGPGTSAKFYSPVGIAVDSTGIVYVADTYNNCIRVITPSL